LSRETPDLQLLKRAALEAVALALSYFRRNPNAWAKGRRLASDGSRLAVDHYLGACLLAERPHYGWLSEETEALGARWWAWRLTKG
jgi:myo-inositol-1(or 4)-monophosphatase